MQTWLRRAHIVIRQKASITHTLLKLPDGISRLSYLLTQLLDLSLLGIHFLRDIISRDQQPTFCSQDDDVEVHAYPFTECFDPILQGHVDLGFAELLRGEFMPLPIRS